MKIAYFDCFSGASGDMILSSLLYAGLPEAILREGLKRLNLDTFELHVQQVLKSGFRATQVRVEVHQQSPPRRLDEIEAIIRSSALDLEVQEKALRIFERLASVEAGIHGKELSEVHLHELSGDDTIVDVVGSLIGFQQLGIEQIVVSPIPLGRGTIEAAHGKIPLPAPATLELLKNAPVYGSPLEVELVTPTAAVLFSELAYSFGAIPPMRLEAVGYGAGTRDLPVPNLLRLLIGTSEGSTGPANVETLCLLETNLDDFNPQFYEPVMSHLFEAGAVDVYLSPIQMKKNRPGTLLSMLCLPQEAEKLESILFSETSTLGVRRRLTERLALTRTTGQVQTTWGKVRIKIAEPGGGRQKFSPEYEDCRALAEQHHIPIKDVYLEAQIKGQEVDPSLRSG